MILKLVNFFVGLILLLSFPARAALEQSSTVNEEFQMRLTLTLYQGVLADYFSENKDNSDLIYYSNKAYLQTFLYTWSTLLESKAKHSTADVFQTLAHGNGFLAKYYGKWQSIHSPLPARNKIDMGGLREQFLVKVLSSEAQFPDLSTRMRYLLNEAQVLFVTMGLHYKLAITIAEPFLTANDKGVREQAEALKSMLAWQFPLKVLSLDEMDVLTFFVGRAARAARLASVALALQSADMTSRVFKALAHASRLATTNPFRRISRLKWSVASSAALHAGVLGTVVYSEAGSESEKAASVSGVTPESAPRAPIAVAVSNLWDMFMARYDGDFTIPERKDFVPRYLQIPQQQLIESARASLRDGTPIDYGELFLQSEKLIHVDHRKNSDTFAMDYILNRYDRLKELTAQLFAGDGPISNEQIEAFRKLIIAEAIFNYKRDYPNMTALLLGWGGNCVADTMLFTSLILPYRQRTPGQPMVALYTDHIEAGLLNGTDFAFFLQAYDGSTDATLHKPEYLLELFLRNYEWRNPFARLRFGFGSLFQLGISFGRHDKREGILEGMESADVDSKTPSAGSEGGMGDSETPYAARQNYSRMTRNQKARSAHLSLGFDSSSDPGDAGDEDDDDDRQGQSETSPSEQSDPGGGFFAWLNPFGASPKKVSRKPKLTYSLNFDPADTVLMDFTVNTHAVTVHNQETYIEFLRVLRQPKMNDHKFEEFLEKETAARLTKVPELPVINKLYLTPHAGSFYNSFSAFLDITADDLHQMELLDNELSQIVTIQPFSELRMFSTLASHLKNSLEHDKFASEIEKLDKIYSDEDVLITKAMSHTESLLKTYDQASPLQRRYMLKRIYGAEFWNYLVSTAGASALQRHGRLGFRDYIAHLNVVKVDFEQPKFWICDKLKIDLPQVKDWPAEWREYPNVQCGKTMVPPPEVVRVDPKGTSNDQWHIVDMKISTLIELTLMTQRGLQLWSANVVGAFVNEHYGEIGVPRAAAVQILNSLIRSDEQYLRDPKFKPILDMAPPPQAQPPQPAKESGGEGKAAL